MSVTKIKYFGRKTKKIYNYIHTNAAKITNATYKNNITVKTKWKDHKIPNVI
jgi:hypothetical protein